METNSQIYVLGHKISPQQISGDYDMVIGETPANMPGPPPHYHSKYHEVFVVLEGEMEFVVNGEQRLLQKGDAIDLPPKLVHTFKNNGHQACKWVNIHSPKGFLSFFQDMGIPVTNDKAVQNSLDESIINKVMKSASDYDMHIQA